MDAQARQLRRALPLAFWAAILACYLVIWARIGAVQTGASDFTNTYVGALLLRTGHGASMYQQALQAPLYLHLVAPLRPGGVLPFLDAPLAAAVAAPITLLSLHTAYRVWSLLQLALLAAAVLIAVRAAPRGRLGSAQLVTWGLVALTGAGTLATLVLGQWDGVSALGVALLYAWLRRRRMAAAGAILAITTLLAKPQLGLGLAAFILGRWDRRLLLGAAGGAAASGVLWLAVAGPAGVAGFAAALAHSVGVWQPSTMVSLLGVTGALLGNTSAAHLLGAAGSLLAMGVAARLGSAVRRHPERLEAGLAAATLLSLLAAPHAYPQDLALLVPAAAWSLTALAARWRSAPALLLPAAVGVWVAIDLAAYLYLAAGAAAPMGALTPWAVIVAAALATGVCARQGRDRTGAARTLWASAQEGGEPPHHERAQPGDGGHRQHEGSAARRPVAGGNPGLGGEAGGVTGHAAYTQPGRPGLR